MSSRGGGRSYDDDAGHDGKRRRVEGGREAGGSAAADEVQDSGGEISMSIEATNRLRESLGLKPLRMGPPAAGGKVERDADAERATKERAKAAEELREKIASQKERRQLDAKLSSTKTLGAADGEEDDDVAAWAEKNKQTMITRKAFEEAAARRAAEAAEGKRRAAEAAEDDDEDGDYSAEQLAGMKVKHGYDELADGDTVIVTMADRELLDAKGNLVDEEDDAVLENALMAEEAKRKKARAAAHGTRVGKPLFQEDGKVRNLLEKYDEEEEELGLQLGAGGALENARAKAQEEMRKKLGTGSNALLDSVVGRPEPGSAAAAVLAINSTSSDYLTSAEAAAAQPAAKLRKKKKKEGRKLRGRDEDGQEGAAAVNGGDDDAGTADLMAVLEAEAAANGGTGDGNLGSRTAGRLTLKERQAAAAVAARDDKRARFDAALDKANWASMALRPNQPAAEAEPVGDDADDELAASLERARRQAAAAAAAAAALLVKKEEADGAVPAEAVAAVAGTGVVALHGLALAEEIAARRAADEAALKAEAASGITFNNASEFVRGIAIKEEPATSAAAIAAGTRSTAGKRAAAANDDMYAEAPAEDQAMEVDEEAKDEDMAGVSIPVPGQWGAWVSADEATNAADKGRQRKLRKQTDGEEAGPSVPVELQDAGLTGERVVGRGLASVLGLLQEKGALAVANKVEWSGRNNDKKVAGQIGLDDIYTGGSSEDRIARAVEQGLTQRDQYGRVMTPKERFRDQCHKFHGIAPSKASRDKRARQDAQEVAVKKAATSENVSAELDKLRDLQKQSGAAYVVLTGKAALVPGSKGAHGSSGGTKSSLPKNGGRDEEGRTTVDPPIPRAKKAGGAGLDGGITPLEGDKKVQALMGGAVRKPPPPPPNFYGK